MATVRKYLTLDEINDELDNPSDLYDDVEHIDAVILPPDVSNLSDEDEASDNITGVAYVNHVPGPLELHLHRASATNEDDDAEPGPSELQQDTQKDSKTITRPGQKRSSDIQSASRKKKPVKLSWKKKEPSYNKFVQQQISSTLDDDKLRLQDKYECYTPVQLFEEIFNFEIVDLLVKETVRYAAENKNDHRFVLSAIEVKQFIGILLLSGYNSRPSERHYWSNSEDLGVDIVKQCMTRDRFLKIKQYLHFQNNNLADDNKGDKLFKVRPLFTLVTESFKKFGVFRKNLSIDEMMVKYYGKHGMKQFMRGKPIRFGYKFWALCDDDGYCYNFDIYCGKNNNDENSGDSLGARVVQKMLSVVVDPLKYNVFFDNFFTSLNLLEDLADKGFRASGTIRENRLMKCPIQDSKTMAKNPRGSFDYRFDSVREICVVKWNDNKCVSIATNYDSVFPTSTVSRYSRTARDKVAIQQPQVLKTYNNFMGGVDKHDWLVGQYVIQIRAKKWYWPLFIRMIDMSVVNAHRLYYFVTADENKLDLLEFRRQVAVTYMKLGITNQRKGRPVSAHSHKNVTYDIRYDSVGHILGKRKEQRRCQQTGCHSKPRTYCTKCNVTLCVTCFAPFHTK